jgi:hypothetical protein
MLKLYWRFDDYDVRQSQGKVCHMHNIYSLTDFPETPLALASMLYHFEPDNDFAIKCVSPRFIIKWNKSLNL